MRLTLLGGNTLLACVAVTLGCFVGWLNQSQPGAQFAGKHTMKAIWHETSGAPTDVLQMIETPLPSFRSWEVLIEVHAASINPVDYKMIQGNFFLIDGLLTHRPGFDVSGKVIAVGGSCSRIKVGDSVYGMTWIHKTGTLAEFIATDESALTVIPANMNPIDAAALPLVSLTSYNSLVSVGKLAAGSRVLVLGGGSATGMIAVQLAKAYGAAHVVATCSPRNDDLLKALGANRTINYLEDDVFDLARKEGEQFDLIYDTVGAGLSVWAGASSGVHRAGDQLPPGARVLAAGGQLVTITGDVQRVLDVYDLITRGYQIVSRKLYCAIVASCGYHQYTQPGGNNHDLDVLSSLVRDGKLRAVVDKTYRFELDQVKEAFEYLMTGRARGKVVIVVKNSIGE